MSQLDKDQAIRHAVQERLLRRSVTDIEFRRLLIDNPKSALARELGIDVPDNIHITVLAESEDQLFIVIPPISRDAVSTGLENLADRSPAYASPAYAAPGLQRLVGSSPAYGPASPKKVEQPSGGNPNHPTGVERLAGNNPAYR